MHHSLGSTSGAPLTRPAPKHSKSRAPSKGRPMQCRVEAVAQVSTTNAKTTTSPASSPPLDQQKSAPPTTRPISSIATPTANDEAAAIMAAKISAVASKINAARELARRLTEEKQAATGKAGGTEAVRNAEEASAAAAAQAARADALARALRKAENSRDQLQRLKSENEALRELLMELAADKAAAQSRLLQVAEAAASGVLIGSPPTAIAQAVAAGATLAVPPPEVLPPPAAVPAAVQAPVIASPAIQQLILEQPVEQLAAVAAAVAAPVAPEAPVEVPAAPEVVEDFESEQAVADVEAPEQEIEYPRSAWPPAAPPAPSTAPTPYTPSHPKPGMPPPTQPTSAVYAGYAPPSVAPPELDVEEAAPAMQEAPEVEAAPAALEAVPVDQAGVAVEPEAVPAPKGLLQQKPATSRPSYVQDRIKASIPQLQQLAAMTAQANLNVFSLPPAPVPIDGPVRLFYNRAKGNLPQNSSLKVRVGLNRWDSIVEADMTPVEYLPRNNDQHWFEATLDLPAEIFQVDFVLHDKRSNQYDNNNFKDYRLELSGAPSEQQLMDIRLEAYRTFELQRIAYLESENARLWRAVELAAMQAAGAARIQFREEREVKLRKEAAAMVDQRRKVELSGLPVKDSEKGVYAWPASPIAGKKAYLAYNKGRGPLANCNTVRLHLGYDGWFNQIKQNYDLYPMTTDEIEQAGVRKGVEGNHMWYGGWVDVPHSGMVLDFVFSDQAQTAWDNNNYQDYHTRVKSAHTTEQLSELMYASLKKDTESRDQGAEDRVARRAYQRIIQRGEAMRKRRATMNNFLYTVPYLPVAGQKVEVYYNPEHTPLRGRPNIYLRAGFNRWKWNQENGRPSESLKMEPTIAGGFGFYHTELEVPEDAWGMDMVFIDTADDAQATGFYDNNGGLDYHVNVRSATDGNNVALGATSVPVRSPLKIVHIAVEMAPIAKVGGMGDVVTALGRAVQEEGHDVEVIIPKYDCINYAQVEYLRQEGSFPHGGTSVRVWKGVVEGLQTTFLEPENGHFWRGCIYGRNDDATRFGFLCSAALAYLQAYNVRPSILHCHDWQTAPIAWGNRNGAKCVFTIHNLSYGADLVGRAMAAAEVATTVSPTYASEISGHNAIAAHLGKFYGIRNGIDADVWNPLDDLFIPMAYGPEEAVEGKEAARRELRTRLGLGQIDVPIVSCVTRLVAQKGIHLIKHAAWRTLERGGQFVLLGSAPDPRVQGEFNALRDQLIARYHERAALVFTYDEPLSHLIYAGSDMFLVPSMFEPCGLTQMIAMRYGTVPIVRRTGGLADTVFDVDHDEDRAAGAGMEVNGFNFESVDAAGMDYALNRALSMWFGDRAGWKRLVSNIMQQDWSWFSPALDYLELYYKALKQ